MDKSSDASKSKRENEEIHWVASPLIFWRNSRCYECPRSHRGMVNYRAGSLNSQSTVLFNNATLWHMIVYRTENKSKTWREAEIPNRVALSEGAINIALEARNYWKTSASQIKDKHTWPNQSHYNSHITMSSGWFLDDVFVDGQHLESLGKWMCVGGMNECPS